MRLCSSALICFFPRWSRHPEIFTPDFVLARVVSNWDHSGMASLIHDYYAAFNSGDREALLAMLADDVVHEINEGSAETGKHAFRSFLGRMDRCYRETVEDLMVFAGREPNRAAAEFFIRGEYLATDDGLPEATGQKYHLRVGAFFDLRDGRITRVTNHYNLQAWLEMVGA